MEERKPERRIDPTLRDIRPLPKRAAEVPSPKPKKKSRFSKKLGRAIFILGLALLILTVSVTSTRFLIKNETGQSPFAELKNLVGALVAIGSDLNKLKSEGFSWALSGRGEELIALLKDLEANVAKLDALGVGFIEEGTLKTADEGLKALIGFIDRPGEKRILILFLNPSEMRPIGGFAGSYGEVVLERGSVKEIKVNDIYYPDKFLPKKLVPPKELQTVTVDWGARDAAWFFDFPTSAEKTIELLEASDIYSKDNIHFDGVVAVNVRVIEDVLAQTGPIKLSEYDLTLDKDNFLAEIQREVEAGRDKQAGENPKKVLEALTPLLTERLEKLDSSKKDALSLALLARAANKDIQFYFKDTNLEDFIRQIGWSGEIAAFNQDEGDYLAVVNTNVAGGKTDARIEQKINLRSEISSDGWINDRLVVSRRHFGKENEEPWYRALNQNFIRILAPTGAELVSLKGETPKNVSPRVDYDAAGYSRDPLLTAYERAKEELGKKIFSAWFSTPLGETKQLEVNYRSGQISLGDKVKYRFVMDKQSGVESEFQYEVVAPPGYKWLESNGSTFAYKSDTIPARLVLELTLIKE